MALRALPRCWARLVGFSGGVKLFSVSIVIIKIYPALSAAIGGRDGMDCSRRVWMTCSIIRTRHQPRRLRMIFVVGDVGHSFSWIYTYI
jgi:hypothetical protein